MAEQKRIMVLFEDGKIRNETILYAIELARRMESALSVLMLLTDEDEKSKNFVEAELDTIVETIQKDGIQAKREIRYGDKTSELLKFLASDHHPSTIVWGSNDNVITKRGGKPGHWLTKTARHVGCSIVSPIIKNS
jgi:K+-sensing histidine kinase KdpD